MLFRHYSKQEVLTVAEHLKQVFNQTELPDLPVFTVSGGVTQFVSGDTVQSFFKRADNALYKAKQAGRNRIIAE